MYYDVLFDWGHFRWQEVIWYAPHAILDVYEKARKTPYYEQILSGLQLYKK